MSDLIQELTLAFRTFRKSPTFALVIVLTLALGIGANTAIFGLMDQLLFRLLPVASPERLVVLDGPGPFFGSTRSYSDVLTPFSHPMFESLRDQSQVFSGVLAFYPTSVHVTLEGQTLDASGQLVSGTFFPVLGVKPELGRLLGPEDDQKPGGHPVIVLGYSFWKQKLGGDPGVVGRSLLVNGHPMTIVGVSAAGFHGVEVGDSLDLYVPLMMQSQVLPTWNRGLGSWRVRWLTLMARLEDGVSLDEARVATNVLYRQLLRTDLDQLETRSESFRTRFAQKEIILVPGGRGTSSLREQSRTPLLVLMGMVALVLLIACANVANLLLARAMSRRKEIALRVALGASRARLVRQLVTESMLLAFAGGAAGILFASWTGELLIRSLPNPYVTEVFSADPDLRVGLFAFLVSSVTGLLFGLAPAIQSTRPDIGATLKNESGTLSGRFASARFRRGLVVAQIALSLLLLIGAGLFVRSLVNLTAIDPGFRPQKLLTFTVDPSLNGYDLDRRRAILRQLREEIASEPGVISVSLAEVALMTSVTASSTVRVEGYESQEGEDMNPGLNEVGPGFFSTTGIPLVAGREFSEADVAGAPRVAIVNEAFVRYFFEGEDPIGRRFGFAREADLDITIVGVSRDGKSATLREETERFLYLPYMQSSDLGSVTLYVRTALDASALGGPLHQAVARVDPTLPVTDLKTMETQIEESLFVERMVAALSVAFGCLATLLAALGLYGLMSYAVSLRTREIGIRVALGAGRRGVLTLVLKEVAWLAVMGFAVGLPAGYAFGRVVETELYGLSARDPLTIALATLVLASTALVAGYLPAARASRVEPTVALRYE